ncbi:MAG: HepT-like ribonuclease domain-containing protein [Luteolibacter sp.]
MAGKTLADLLAERTLQLVLEREFEILGEALYRIHNLAPDSFEQIPSGHRIIGMRNILAHGYDRVDYEVLWAAASLELDSLLLAVENLSAP